MRIQKTVLLCLFPLELTDAALAQGVWLPGFDHKPSGSEVAPNPNLNLANWITANVWPNAGNNQKMNAIHACVIPSGPHRGEVLVWDGNLTNFGTRAHQPWSIVNPYWPAMNPYYPPGAPVGYRFHNATLQMPAGQGELFCAGQTWMPNGRLFVAGGTRRYPGNPGNGSGTGAQSVWEGANLVYQWDQRPHGGGASGTDPFGTWWPMPSLEAVRWYPTVTYDGTSDYRGIIIGGTNIVSGSSPLRMEMVNSYESYRIDFNFNVVLLQPPPDGIEQKQAATMPPWSPLGSQRQYWGPAFVAGGTTYMGFGDYPRIHALGVDDPSGSGRTRLLVSGFWTQGFRWSHDRLIDPNFAFPIGFDIGIMGPTGTDIAAEYTTSVLLPGAIGGISTSVARIGGNRYPAAGTPCPSNMVEIVAATTQSPPAYWQAGPNLSTARFQGNVVILPTGELFAIGGTNCLNSNPSDPSQYNLTPELLVNGTSWVAMAPHTGPRHYHSCALLLPDARVFVCGGEQRDVDYQIWEPPYLTNGVRPQDVAVTDSLGQPVSSTARPGMPRGQQFQASWTNMLPPGVVVDRVVLMRPGALTHHDDGGQRCVRLKAWHPEDAEGDNTVTFESPSRHAAPAGWWMLFLLTSAGVPSIAYWVNLP